MLVAGIETQIDECDMNLIHNYHWFSNKGYIVTRVDGKNVFLHRIIAERMGLDSSKEIDHIDGDPKNNCRSNLRSVTRQQNCMNKGIHSNNTSGIPGVCYDKQTGKWRAAIGINYKYIHLGRFKDKKAAEKARKEAEIKYFGDYRRK